MKMRNYTRYFYTPKKRNWWLAYTREVHDAISQQEAEDFHAYKTSKDIQQMEKEIRDEDTSQEEEKVGE